MGYIPGLGRAMNDLWESSANGEELDLPHGEFVARNGKAFRMTILIAAIIATVSGTLLIFLLSDEIGILFLVLGLCLLVVLPTILSYRCIVNKNFMREEYYILFLKKQKEILWSDVAYKKIKLGNNNSIKLYDKNKKRLISFDGTTVGFNRIIKLAKRSGINEIDKK